MSFIRKLLSGFSKDSKRRNELTEEAAQYASSLGSQPSILELKKLETMTQELISLGHKPSLVSMAHIQNLKIKSHLAQSDQDWENPNASQLSQSDKTTIMSYASVGLVALGEHLKNGGNPKEVERISNQLQKYNNLTK